MYFSKENATLSGKMLYMFVLKCNFSRSNQFPLLPVSKHPLTALSGFLIDAVNHFGNRISNP